jgi:hypothetical protein
VAVLDWHPSVLFSQDPWEVISMRKLKTFVAALMLVFVLGIAAPQALAGDMNSPPAPAPGDVGFPPGDIQTPGIAGDIHIPGKTGEMGTPGIAFWATTLVTVLGNSWNV